MGIITDNLDLWGEALWGTVVLFLAGGALALVLGVIVGAMRVSPIPVARTVGTLYVNTVRNTPLTLIFFFFAFGAPLLVDFRVNFLILGDPARSVCTRPPTSPRRCAPASTPCRSARPRRPGRSASPSARS